MIRRRAFVSSALALAAAPLAARAQVPDGRTPRFAWVQQALTVEKLGENGPPRYRSLYQELARLGWIEGSTIVIERRTFASQTHLFAQLARDGVGSAPDIVVTNGGVVVQAFQAATQTIPIVAAMSDPLTRGLVQ